MKRICVLASFFLCAAVHAQISQTVTFDPSNLQVKTQNIDGARYSVVTLPGLFSDDIPGKPQLPCKMIQLIIPPEQVIDGIDISTGRATIVSIEHPIIPAPTHVLGTNAQDYKTYFSRDRQIYSSGKHWPDKAAIVTNQGFFDGDKHIASIQICPFSYEPASNRLTFFSNVQISVRLKMMTSKDKLQQPFMRPSGKQVAYDAILRSMVENKDDIARYSLSRKSAPVGVGKTAAVAAVKPPFYEYVVITSPDLKNSFSRLIDWKRQKGLNAGVVGTDQIYAYYTAGDVISGINDDAGKIRRYLYEAWQSGTTIWVVLGGHASKVPVRHGTANNDTYSAYGALDAGNIPTDLYFASLTDSWNKDGDKFYGEPNDDIIDYKAEVFVGRVLCRTDQEVNNWTDLLLQYEKLPGGPGGGSYLTKTLHDQTDEYQDQKKGPGTKGCAQEISADISAYGFTSKIMEELPGPATKMVYAPQPADVIREMDSDYGMVFLWLHAGPWNLATMSGSFDQTNNPCPATPYEGCDPWYNGNDRRNMVVHESVHPSEATVRLSNSLHPKVFFLASCLSSDFGTKHGQKPTDPPVFSSMLMLKEKGGPAVFGNTEAGFYNYSLNQTKAILSYLFTQGVVGLTDISGTPDGGGGVADALSISSGEKEISLNTSFSFTAKFTDADYTGTTASAWNWKIVLLHSRGEFTAASQQIQQSTNQSAWTSKISILPSGYTWLRTSSGAIQGKVMVSVTDSDGIPHLVSIALSFYEGSIPAPSALSKAAAERALQVHSSQAGVCEFVGKQITQSGGKHYITLSHNLLGCPEMSIWTETPKTFDNVTVSLNASSPATLRVISNVPGATIAVASTQANKYFSVARRVSEYSFASIPLVDFPIRVTVTKENYLPYQTFQNIISQEPASAVIMSSGAIPFTVSGSTAGRTNAFDVEGLDGPDAVYNLTLKKATVLDVSLCNATTNFDTKLEIFKSDRSTTGFYNDDDYTYAANPYLSTLRNVALPAGDYFIVIDGYNGAAGNYSLAVSYSNTGSQTIASLPFNHRSTTTGKTNKWDVQGTDNLDAEYLFTLNTQACITATTCNSYTNFNSMLEIFKYDRSRANVYNNDYTCSSGGTKATIAAGRLLPGQYYLVVDGSGTAKGNYDLSVDYASDNTITKLPYTHSSTTLGKKDDWDVFYHDNEDVTYKLDLTVPTMIDVSLCNTATKFDAKLEIFNENGTTTGYFADDDNSCAAGALRPTIYQAALAPGRYFIVVDGFGTNAGNYSINVKVSSGLAKQPFLKTAAITDAFLYEAKKARKQVPIVPVDMQPENIRHELDKILNDGVIPRLSNIESYQGQVNGQGSSVPENLTLETIRLDRNQIRFGIPTSGNVEITMYSLNGAVAMRIPGQRWEAGFHTVSFANNPMRLKSRMYIVSIKTKGASIQRKITLMNR